ncbi:MAG: prepilin-type N-terminal cleavage/methylation domain-containing protein [Chloroflexi bacterium]|nr:prepilin-type N-terminal cleavage/methylation domain-containing protein [Chloroflexota bacterium]
MKQKGFTLVEVIVALGLMSLVTVGATSGVFYMLKASAEVSNRLPGLNSVQIAGRWVSRDAQMAKNTDLVDGAPAVDIEVTPVTFYRTDYYNDPHTSHTTVYRVLDGELQREEDGQSTIVARDLTGVTFSISGRTVTVIISSEGQSRTYQATLRSQ